MPKDIKQKIEDEIKIESSETKPKKRGRRTNAQIEADKQKSETVIDETLEDQKTEFTNSLRLFSETALDLLAPRLPNPVPFTITEKEMFGKSLSALAGKYFSLLNNYDIELSFLFASLILFYPRMKVEKKKINDNDEQENKVK